MMDHLGKTRIPNKIVARDAAAVKSKDCHAAQLRRPMRTFPAISAIQDLIIPCAFRRRRTLLQAKVFTRDLQVAIKHDAPRKNISARASGLLKAQILKANDITLLSRCKWL